MRRTILGITQIQVERLHNFQQDVQANHVRQSQRTHGVVTAAHHTLVHVLHCADVLIQNLYGLVEHRQQHAVDNETGLVLGQDGALAHVLAHCCHGVNGGLIGAQAVNNLHQAHNRHRREEVHSHNLLRTGSGSGQAGHRDRRGIGGKNGAVVADFIQLLENSPLGIQILIDGLNYQIHIGGGMYAGGNGQAVHTGLLLLGGHASLFYQTVQPLADASLPPLKGSLALVVQDDLITVLQGGLGDAASHQTGTNHKDFTDFHFDLLLFVLKFCTLELLQGPTSAEIGQFYLNTRPLFCPAKIQIPPYFVALCVSPAY